MSDAPLWAGLDGEPAMLADVMADGLDGDLDDRIPALLECLGCGTPEERYNAAYLLVAWDVPEALETLRAWGHNPDELPRATANRFTGSDASFGPLAESLGAGGHSPRAAATLASRVDAGAALLGLADVEDFERHLSVALGWNAALRGELVDAIEAAAERAIERLERGDRPSFDLWTQAAGLLYPLAKERDAAAARLADRLIPCGRRDRRMLLELVDALAAGRGAATLAVLDGLQRKAKVREVREAARAAVDRRR